MPNPDTDTDTDAYTIDVNHAPSAEEQAAAQNGWLWAYNVAQTGDDAYTPLVISLRDDRGNVVGGLVGSYLWGWLKIESFSVEPSLRGRGFGSGQSATPGLNRSRPCAGVVLVPNFFWPPKTTLEDAVV